LKIIHKKTVVASYEVPFMGLPRGAEKNHKTPPAAWLIYEPTFEPGIFVCVHMHVPGHMCICGPSDYTISFDIIS
jgi:hypothetical protein